MAQIAAQIRYCIAVLVTTAAVVSLVSKANAYTIMQPPIKKPARLEHLEGCYSEWLDTVVRPDRWYSPNYGERCMIMLCRGDNDEMQIHICGTVGVDVKKECPMDIRKPYPYCCPEDC